MTPTTPNSKPPMPARNSPAASDGLEQSLRREVHAVKIGERLPSIRQLRSRYGAGQAAVERAIARLGQQGLIEVRPKSGIYRSKPPAGSVAVIYRSEAGLDEGTYYGDFVMNLIAELAKTGHLVRFHTVSENRAFATLVRHLSRMHERAVTFALKWTDVETIDAQTTDPPGFIHVLPNFVEPIDNAVTLDDRDIIRLQVEHLIERGHRRIGYLHNYREDVWSRPASQRYHAFRDLALQHGLTLGSEYMQTVGNEGQGAYAALQAMLNTDTPPTACLINGDTAVREVYRALRDTGRNPGRDFAVVSVNNRPWAKYVQPGLTSIDIPPRRGAEAVTRILQCLEAGEPTRGEVLRAELKIRASSDFALPS